MLEIVGGADEIIMRQSENINKNGRTEIQKDMIFVQFCSLRAHFAHSAFSTVPLVLIFVAVLPQITEEFFKTEKSTKFKNTEECTINNVNGNL